MKTEDYFRKPSPYDNYPALRTQEEKKLGVKMLPLVLVLNDHASSVSEIMVSKAFAKMLGEDLEQQATIFHFIVDKEPYYHAFYGGGDNQMSPIGLVTVWYYLKPVVIFPLYLMKIGNQRKFLSMAMAGVTFDNGFAKVEICGDVMEKDGSVRSITKKEERRISELADEHSDSK